MSRHDGEKPVRHSGDWKSPIAGQIGDVETELARAKTPLLSGLTQYLERILSPTLFATLVVTILLLTACTDGASETLRFPAFERSVAVVEEALKKHPGALGILQVRARLYFRNGRFEEAVPRFEEVIARDRKSPDLYLGLASSHSSLGQSEKAIAVYRRALALGNPRVEVTARLGIAEELHKLARYEEEVRELRKVPKPAWDPRVHYRLGRALDLAALKARPEQTDALQTEALKSYDQALAMVPNYVEALYARGRLLLSRGDARGKKDLEMFRRVNESIPGVQTENMARSGAEFEARTLMELAGALSRAKDVRGGLKLLDRSRELGVLTVKVESARGALLYRSGQVKEAENAFRAVLAVDPENPDALWNLGKILLKVRQLDEAARCLSAALQHNPNIPGGWELMADAAAKGLIFAEYEEDFARRALKMRPSPANYLRLARLLARQGKVGECEQVLLQGLQRYPDHPELHAELQKIRGVR